MPKLPKNFDKKNGSNKMPAKNQKTGISASKQQRPLPEEKHEKLIISALEQYNKVCFQMDSQGRNSKNHR